MEIVKSRFKRVCVFCGSSRGNRDCYRDAAIDLAQEMRVLNLVYGGGSIGIMGLVSQAVHEAGGHVLGIIPRTLMDKKITGKTFGEVRAVADMHQRKAEMALHSHSFIALPDVTAGKKIVGNCYKGAFCGVGYVIGGLTSSPVAKQVQETEEIARKELQQLDEYEAHLEALTKE